MDARSRLKQCRRVVVKVGTTTLAHENGRMNLRRVERLCWVLAELRHQGKEVILVSSGAIAVGADRLMLKERPRDTRGKQAASAVGQAILMQMYENMFMHYNQTVAQILLTKDVIDDDTRYENARNTFSALLEMGVIPIVNENDSISTDELGFSENDTLSAYVSRLVNSDILVILSDIDGLYDADPRTFPNAARLSVVEELTPELLNAACGSATCLGTGGMAAKLSAARIAAQAGIPTVVASGENPAILFDVLEGGEYGTLFVLAAEG